MANLAVNTESFHYRYYCWIRKVWGYGEIKECTSLCPYFQTMLWGSIFSILLSPCLLIGWVCMKIGRLATKIEHPIFDKFLVWFGRRFDWLDELDQGPDKFSESPLAAGLLYTGFGLTMIVCTTVVVSVTLGILALLGFGVWNIGPIAGTLAYVFAHIGWLAVLVFALAGWVFVTILESAVWLFTNGELWWTVGSWIVYMMAWFFSVGICSVLLCLLSIWICKLQFVRNIGTKLMNKFNGFSEAKVAREKRLKAVRAAQPKRPAWTCQNCGYNNNVANTGYCQECDHQRVIVVPWAFTALKCALTPIIWPISQCMSVYAKVQGQEINIMGPFSIVWEYLVAIKKGVCPIIEFVDMDTIRSRQQEAAAERMGKDERMKKEQDERTAS